MDYIQNAPHDAAAMLKAIGVASVQDLFVSIPKDIRLGRALNLPAGLPEQELLAHMAGLAARNRTTDTHTSFLGGGAYSHYFPALVDQVAGRGEWVTSYTPYQAEASQGTLQSIFEYQTLICELTGLDVANASHYDGSTALAEAVAMALDHSDKNRILVSAAVNPQHREVLKTMFKQVGVEFVELATFEGATSTSGLAEYARTAAAVVVQSPNYFGVVEDLAEMAKAAHEGGAKAIASVNPVSLGLLEPPGACGMDIAVGDAQPFGIETSFGGPWCGFIAAKMELIRQMPGRLVGQTVDGKGRRGFCLTLQAREQHIRREKASSNICTNQALMALRATITMAALGRAGLRQMATLCVQRAHELHDAVTSLPGVSRPHKEPFFHEFAIQTPVEPALLNDRLLARGFIGGVDLQKSYQDLPRGMLLCATERISKADIGRFRETLADCLKDPR